MTTTENEGFPAQPGEAPQVIDVDELDPAPEPLNDPDAENKPKAKPKKPGKKAE